MQEFGEMQTRPVVRLPSRSLATVLGCAVALPLWIAGAAACEPVKLPHEQPGPVGCGTRDPRDTAPGMLSVAQKEAVRKLGTPGEVRPNERGGLDWLYRRSAGSVFGEEQTVETLSFDIEGLLFRQDTEVLHKVGK